MACFRLDLVLAQDERFIAAAINDEGRGLAKS